MPFGELIHTTVHEEAMRLVTEERKRQVDKEGFGLQHDDEHTNFQLRDAAICYLLGMPRTDHNKFDWKDVIKAIWPWDWKWWKPDNKAGLRCLVVAAALILAEIERLIRWEIKERYTRMRQEYDAIPPAPPKEED